MNNDLILVLILLAGCVGLFILNKPRMDVVALAALVLLPLLGIITVPEALAGFSDPSVVLIAALFVIGEGLVRTGVVYQMGELLLRQADGSPSRLLVMLMLAVAGLGAFMSSTGIVAIFIPVVLSITGKLDIPPGRLMMPLSFAGLISGMMTLVATPPNMVLDSALKRAGLPGFEFFSFTPIGIAVLVTGIAYMLVARRWMGGERSSGASASAKYDPRQLIEHYGLGRRGRRLQVRSDSPLAGKTLQDLELRGKYQFNVVGIERRMRFYTELFSPSARFAIRAGDLLLIDVHSPDGEPIEIPDELGLSRLEFQPEALTDHAREVGMVEVMVPPESSIIGKTVRGAEFRSQFGVNVVGLRRRGKSVEREFLDEPLELGDTLLVIGPWKSVRQLQSQRNDFVVLSFPEGAEKSAPALNRAPYAVLCLGVMVGLMVSGVVPNVLAALIACLLMGAFRCIDVESAYKSIHWQSLIVIVGMMPFALSLQKTGGIELAVGGMMELLGGAGPRVLLGSLFVVTAVTGMFISNTATAVLMAPIALSIAEHAGASPRPFAMMVAVAASAAFMTPVSSPVNTIVMGPGQYRFVDFVKVGVPFTVIVLVISTVMVPWLFPLHPG